MSRATRYCPEVQGRAVQMVFEQRSDHESQCAAIQSIAANFIYVSTWAGFVYVAIIVDVFARYIVGWKASSSARTDFVLDALEQALHARRPSPRTLTHHIDCGVQYVPIRYTERLAKAGIG